MPLIYRSIWCPLFHFIIDLLDKKTRNPGQDLDANLGSVVLVECEVEEHGDLGPVPRLTNENDPRVPRERAGEVRVPCAARHLREVHP